MEEAPSDAAFIASSPRRWATSQERGACPRLPAPPACHGKASARRCRAIAIPRWTLSSRLLTPLTCGCVPNRCREPETPTGVGFAIARRNSRNNERSDGRTPSLCEIDEKAASRVSGTDRGPEKGASRCLERACREEHPEKGHCRERGSAEAGSRLPTLSRKSGNPCTKQCGQKPASRIGLNQETTPAPPASLRGNGTRHWRNWRPARCSGSRLPRTCLRTCGSRKGTDRRARPQASGRDDVLLEVVQEASGTCCRFQRHACNEPEPALQ